MSTGPSASDVASEGNTLNYIFSQLLGNLFFIDIVRVEAIQDELLTVRSLLPGIFNAGEPVQRQSTGRVPFLRLQGGDSAVIMDPRVGDIGLMAVCDKDISDVKKTRTDALPASLRRHDAADGIYLTGISLLNSPPAQYVRFDPSGIEIKSPGTVTINGLTIHPDGRLQLVNGVIVDTHIHDGVEPGNGKTGRPQ
ncbi:hypothetical protein ABW11_21000 [Pluralibacter gergoviae]|uniref:hypothetical protein n=1 Tax=Pluralibacter gergoviae TaxID=61647 RepID=UPI000652287C|nr:hypothetical protein [Pluralibacter gergoviae]KMK23091.1 hypothetical protein ABW11_21000 [Pluralibacter gergoviae]